MKHTILLLFLVLATATTGLALPEFTAPPQRMADIEGAHADEAKWRAYFSRDDLHDFDVTFYDLHLDIDPVSQVISGTNHMTAFSTLDGLTQITLDLAGNMTVDSVVMDGQNLTFAHQGNSLVIDLGQPLNMDDSFTVSVTYHGVPASGIYFFGSNEISTHNEPSDARFWIPCWDHPHDKADSLAVHYTLPAEWHLAANGLPVEVVDNGDGTKTHYWFSGYPITTYLISFCASPDYEVIELEYENSAGETMPMPHYVFDWQYDDAMTSVQPMPEMMTILADLFGEYPFFEEKYSQVSFSIFQGGMENQTLSHIHWSMFDGTYNNVVWLFSHELAHQWFGDAISPGEWADIWLNEGFASYAEALYYEALGGDINDWTVDVMLNSYFSISYEHAIYDPPEGYLFSRIVYEKAGLVLHMLRGIVGDDIFYEILDTYYEQYKYSTATTPDFQAVCETVIGEDMDWFFQEWIYEEGYPIFDVIWDSWETDSGYMLEARLQQIQSDDWGYFTMPTVAGARFADDSDQVEEILVDGWETVVQMPLDQAPTEFVLDPEQWFTIKKVNAVETGKKFELVSIDIQDANSNQLIELGETVDLVLGLQNLLAPATDVTATLSCDSPHITIESETGTFGDIETDAIAENTETPFTFSVSQSFFEGDIEFTLNLTSADGYSKSLSFNLFLGIQSPLIIDDDGGAEYDAYVREHFGAFWFMGHYWDVALMGEPTAALLNEHVWVVWLTGDEATNTLTAENQVALASYLDNGGSLFLTGQNIAQDLQGSDFLHDYLHASLVNETWTGARLAMGVPGDPISDQMIVTLYGEDGADNQTSMDVLEPQGAAQPIFKYGTGSDVAGLRYEGDYKLVFCGFGTEAMTQASPQATDPVWVYDRILTYLGINLAIEDDSPGQGTNLASVLRQNYPNPFNPSTSIRFDLAERSPVRLDIYDISGRLVKTLVDATLPAGPHTVNWDGTTDLNRSATSGVYLYKIQAGEWQESRSMILMK